MTARTFFPCEARAKLNRMSHEEVTEILLPAPLNTDRGLCDIVDVLSSRKSCHRPRNVIKIVLLRPTIVTSRTKSRSRTTLINQTNWKRKAKLMDYFNYSSFPRPARSSQVMFTTWRYTGKSSVPSRERVLRERLFSREKCCNQNTGPKRNRNKLLITPEDDDDDCRAHQFNGLLTIMTVCCCSLNHRVYRRTCLVDGAHNRLPERQNNEPWCHRGAVIVKFARIWFDLAEIKCATNDTFGGLEVAVAA